MYYEFELGKAFYVTNERHFEGELTLKRQIKVENSELEYVLDSSLTIQDEILQQTSATAKFKVANSANEFFLGWTTTPWTLPANEAAQIQVQGVPFYVFNRKYAVSGAQPPTFHYKSGAFAPPLE